MKWTNVCRTLKGLLSIEIDWRFNFFGFVKLWNRLRSPDMDSQQFLFFHAIEKNKSTDSRLKLHKTYYSVETRTLNIWYDYNTSVLSRSCRRHWGKVSHTQQIHRRWKENTLSHRITYIYQKRGRKEKLCIIKKETKGTFRNRFGTEKSNGLNVSMKNVDKSFSFVVSFRNLIQLVLMLLFIIPPRFVFQGNFDDLSNFPPTNRFKNFNHIQPTFDFQTRKFRTTSTN